MLGPCAAYGGGTLLPLPTALPICSRQHRPAGQNRTMTGTIAFWLVEFFGRIIGTAIHNG